MQKINFEAGSEKRFVDFTDNIIRDDKVALISHTDLDGIASAKVVKKCVDVDEIFFLNYPEFNLNFVKILNERGFNKLIFTDFSIVDFSIIKELESNFDVLIIDHHVFEKDFNSDKVVFMNSKEYCAAYICYYLFLKVKDIEYLDWIVCCACIADWMYFNNQDWMKKIYEKYGDSFEFENDSVKKSGIMFEKVKIISNSLIYFGDNVKKVFELLDGFDSTNFLKEYSTKVQREIDDFVKRFYDEREKYGDIYFWVMNPKFEVKSIVTSIISSKEYNKTFIFLKKYGKYYSISARRQDKKVNMVDLLGKLRKGLEDSDSGGHIPAAGGRILIKDLNKFRERVKNYEISK